MWEGLRWMICLKLFLLFSHRHMLDFGSNKNYKGEWAPIINWLIKAVYCLPIGELALINYSFFFSIHKNLPPILHMIPILIITFYSN